MLPLRPMMLNSPADILAQFLINQKIGVAAQDPPIDWQIQCVDVGWLPPQPDSLIACSDTQGRNFGNLQQTGESIEQYGVQIRIRAVSPLYANAKGFQIRNYLDAIYRDKVLMTGLRNDGKLVRATYEISSVIHKGILSLGREKPAEAGQDSGRSLFGINALMFVDIVNLS